MQTSKHSTSKKSNYFFDKNALYHSKANQVKSAKNLNISLGANDSLNSLNIPSIQQRVPLYAKFESIRDIRNKSRGQEIQKPSLSEISHKLNFIAQQNQKLKQENQLLRQQLYIIKKQKNNSMHQISTEPKQRFKTFSREYSNDNKSGDLRNTIKKQPLQQMGDIKQLKIKVEILSKQCKMYEQIIDKMQCTIKRLTDDNKMLHSKNKSYEKNYEHDTRKQEFQQLKQSVNMIMKEYSNLESKMHSNELEWVIWKEQWITEKNIYLNKIKQLEQKLKEKKSH